MYITFFHTMENLKFVSTPTVHPVSAVVLAPMSSRDVMLVHMKRGFRPVPPKSGRGCPYLGPVGTSTEPKSACDRQPYVTPPRPRVPPSGHVSYTLL